MTVSLVNNLTTPSSRSQVPRAKPPQVKPPQAQTPSAMTAVTVRHCLLFQAGEVPLSL